MNFSDYFQQTEHAVKQLFESLNFYKNLMHESIVDPPIIFYSTIEDRDKQFNQWYDKNKPTIDKARNEEKEYRGLLISESIISGSILQVAYSAIEMFSENSDIHSEFQEVINTGSKSAKFCIGRIIRNVPIGLLIYAGRNQHAHANEETLHKANKYILDKIANYFGEGIDPCFDPSQHVLSIAFNILGVMEWQCFGDYEKDLKSLLDSTP